MELRHLRYFIAVAEELHFGRAAERLHIAQPPLSFQIKALEDELGAKLFERNKRRVALTAAGQVFYNDARQIVERAAEAKCRAAKVARGALGRLEIGFTVAASFNDMFLPRLAYFQQQWPEIEVGLQQMGSMSQLEALCEGRIDIGFVSLAGSAPLPAGLITGKTVHDRMVAALPTSHPLAQRTRLDMGELRDEAFIVPSPASNASYFDTVLSLCAAAGFEPRIAATARQTLGLLTLAAAGRGVALVTEGVQRAAITGLKYVKIDDPNAAIETRLVCRADDSSVGVRSFLLVDSASLPR